jgi:inner membrane protein
VLAVCCSLLPDTDVISRLVGNQQLETLVGGHRGLTHSVSFALLIGLIALAAFRGPDWRARRGQLWLSLAAATASHGLVDSLTTYGPGVALLAPLSWIRFKAPWQPLGRGACRGVVNCLSQGLAGELIWLGLPALLLSVAIIWWRRRLRDGSMHAAA